MIQRIENCTRVLGQEQGYLGLPVRDEIREVRIAGEPMDCRAMVTAWPPTPEEVERIKAGATIYLSVLGEAHPPVILEVGEVPE